MGYQNFQLSAFYLGALASFIQHTIKEDHEPGQINGINIGTDAKTPYITFETPNKIHTISVFVSSEEKP